MQQRRSAGRPTGTDGSDFNYRMVVDSRYQRVADGKSRLCNVILFQAVLQLIGILYTCLMTFKGRVPNLIAISSITICSFSLIIGELGRRRTQEMLLKVYMVASSVGVILSIVYVAKGSVSLQVAGRAGGRAGGVGRAGGARRGCANWGVKGFRSTRRGGGHTLDDQQYVEQVLEDVQPEQIVMGSVVRSGVVCRTASWCRFKAGSNGLGAQGRLFKRQGNNQQVRVLQTPGRWETHKFELLEAVHTAVGFLVQIFTVIIVTSLISNMSPLKRT